jgi:hypothetical protein
MAEQDQNIISSMLGAISDALTRDKLTPEDGTLTTRKLPNGITVVVQGARRNNSGKLVGGKIIGRAGSQQDDGESIASKINFKNGGSVKNFKGTF